MILEYLNQSLVLTEECCTLWRIEENTSKCDAVVFTRKIPEQIDPPTPLNNQSTGLIQSKIWE